MMARAKFFASRSPLPASGATITATDIATGSIISVVEVFCAHMLTNPVAHIMPSTSPCGCPPAQDTMV